MRLYSLIRDRYSLIPAEVELTLVPGLPQIVILGLPDALIKESAARIKASLRAQGFQFPVAQQILVNLKPHHHKKTSRGVELAIAAALLMESKQVVCPEGTESMYFYGELSLNGEIHAPDDLGDFVGPATSVIVTGLAERQDTAAIGLRELGDFRRFPKKISSPRRRLAMRPSLDSLSFSPASARVMAIVATGEHHTLVVGPHGTGKSTWAKPVVDILREPEAAVFRQSTKIARHFRHCLTWRPLIAPHHSATPLAVIGGGVRAAPGLITRAHGGVLLLDELLEFPRSVHEALREPLEEGSISVARANETREYPARFLLLATTNLCPCGYSLPDSALRCRCSSRRRSLYRERLSGPLLDRFQVLAVSAGWGPGPVSLHEVHRQVARAQDFAYKMRKQSICNAQLELKICEEWVAQNPLMLDPTLSRRRLMAVARVARTIADLEQAWSIQPWHWQEALELTVLPFQALERSGE